MGSLLISVPDFTESELVFDANETKQILCYFWSQLAPKINELPEVGIEARRLAQTALVAALEGTYAMGFMEATLTSFGGPTKSVFQWAKKLARGLAQSWLKHTKLTDLRNAKVYDSVRVTVARSLRSRAEEVANQVVAQRTRGPFMYYARVPGARVA